MANPRQFRNTALQPLSYPDTQHQPETLLVSMYKLKPLLTVLAAGYLLVISSGASAFSDTGV